MTRQTITHSHIPAPQSGYTYDPEHQSWLSLCERVYRAGLRIVPASEGGQPITWDVLHGAWTAVVTVEPVEDRPEGYSARIRPVMDDDVVEPSGAHVSRVMAGCDCNGCIDLRAYQLARKRARLAARAAGDE